MGRADGDLGGIGLFKTHLDITVAQVWSCGSATVLEPRSWNTGRLRGSRALLASFAVAHWPFTFPPCPSFQETEKRVLALGL